MPDDKPEIPSDDGKQVFSLRDMLQPRPEGDEDMPFSAVVNEETQAPGLSPFEAAVHESLTQDALGSIQGGTGVEGEQPHPQYYQVGPDGNLYPTTPPTGGLLSQYVQMGGGTEELDEGISFWENHTTGPVRDENEIYDRIRNSDLINPIPASSDPDRRSLLNHNLEYKTLKPIENISKPDYTDSGQEPGPKIVFDDEGRPLSLVDQDGEIWPFPQHRPEDDRIFMGEDVGGGAGHGNPTWYEQGSIARLGGGKWLGYRPIGEDPEGAAIIDKLSLYGGEVSIGDNRPTGKIREIPTASKLSINEIPIDKKPILPPRLIEYDKDRLFSDELTAEPSGGDSGQEIQEPEGEDQHPPLPPRPTDDFRPKGSTSPQTAARRSQLDKPPRRTIANDKFSDVARELFDDWDRSAADD